MTPKNAIATSRSAPIVSGNHSTIAVSVRVDSERCFFSRRRIVGSVRLMGSSDHERATARQLLRSQLRLDGRAGAGEGGGSGIREAGGMNLPELRTWAGPASRT